MTPPFVVKTSTSESRRVAENAPYLAHPVPDSALEAQRDRLAAVIVTTCAF